MVDLNNILEKLVEIAEHLGLSRSPTFIRHLLASQRFESQLHTKLCFNYLREMHEILLKCGPYGLPPEFDEDLEKTIGEVIGNGNRYPTDLSKLKNHTLISGVSGGGKTIAIANYVEKIVSGELGNNIKVLIFDGKRDYLGLGKKDNVIVLTKDTFRINFFFEEGGLNRNVLSSVMAEVLSATLNLLTASKSLLTFCIDAGYKNAREEIFQIRDLLNEFILLSARPYSPTLQAKDRCISRLNALMRESALGKIFSHPRGIPINFLLENNIVIDLSYIVQQEYISLIVLGLISRIYFYKIINNIRSAYAENVLIFDDCHAAFMKLLEKNQANPLPFINSIIAKLRETGTGLIVASQEPSKILNTLFANAMTHIIVGGLPSGVDKKHLKRVMTLSEEQMEYIDRLDSGDAVVRDPNIPKPFLIHFDMVEMEKDVNEEELSTLGRKALEGVLDFKLESVSKTVEGKALTVFERHFLRNCYEIPFLGVHDRLNALGWGSSKVYAIKRSLKKRGLISDFELRIKKKGRRRKYDFLTSAGINALGVKEKKLRGKGGTRHRYMQKIICDALNASGKGKAVIEKKFSGAAIDVLFILKSGERYAIEIEESTKNLIRNVRKNLGAKVSKVLIIYDGKKLGDDLRSECSRCLTTDERDLVTFHSNSCFLNEIG